MAFAGFNAGDVLSIVANDIHYNEYEVVGASSCRLENFHAVAELVVAGKLRVADLVGTQLPLDRVHEALDLVASGKDQLMYVADITNNPAIFAKNPELKAMFDMDADRAVATRKAILDRAAADKVRVAFYHGAFPSNGFVTKAGNGFDFTPAFWQ